VCVTDFGLARPADAPIEAADVAASPELALPLTQTGALLGTPAYMAPEQLAGERADARADVFAFAVTAFEALYGVRPFEGRTLPGLRAQIEAGRVRAPPPGSRVPARVHAALLGGLRASPDERFGSIDEMLAAIVAKPFPKRIALGAGAIALAGVAALAVAKQDRPSAPPPGPALRATAPRRVTFDPGCEEFPSLSRDGRTVVFDATFGEDSHVVVMDLASGARRTLTDGTGWQFAAALSPDDTRVAYLAQRPASDYGVFVVPLDRSSPPTRVYDGQTRPSWSPDGRAIWAGDGRTIERVDVATRAVTRSLAAPPSGYLTMAVELADGRVLARVYDRETHRGASIVRYDPGSDAGAELVAGQVDETLALAPDGAHLLTSALLATGATELWEVPLGGGAHAPGDGVVRPTKGLAVAAGAIVWSTCESAPTLTRLDPRGTELVASPLFPTTEWDDDDPAGVPGDERRLVVISDRSGERQPWVLDLRAEEPPRTLATPGLGPSEPDVSPDGRLVAFASPGRGVYVLPIDGASPARRLTEGASDGQPTFSRDGHTLYFSTAGDGGAHAIASVPVEGGAPAIVLERAWAPAASPIEDRLAYIPDDGAKVVPRVLDLRTHETSPLVRDASPGLHAVLRFSPDGKRVLMNDGLVALAEVDVASGRVVRRYSSGDQLGSATYVGASVVVARQTWRGDLWTARVAAGR
jgi:Tol biopolymer transport system component